MDLVSTHLGKFSGVANGELRRGLAGQHTATVQVEGTGSVSCTVAIKAGNSETALATVATITASGSGSAVGTGSWGDDYQFWRADVTAMSGTTARVDCASDVAAGGGVDLSSPAAQEAVMGASRNPSVQGIPTATFTEVISARPAELGSWSWFWVVDTRLAPSITAPLARYHIYFSPDHDTRGGVRLYYTDDLENPAGWTLFRGGPDAGAPSLIYEDLDDTASRPATYSTETPSVVYDPIEGKLRVFYHCVNPSYGNGTGALTNVTDPNGARSGCTAYRASQGTMSALQVNASGTQFTKDRAFALDVFWTLGGHGYGDHTGYFVPFYVRGGWAAYHINGSEKVSAFGLSRAIGGDVGRWRSQKRQLARYTHLFKDAGYANVMVGWNGCIAVETANGLMILGSATTPASGLDQGTKLMFCAPLADDLRTITGPVQIISTAPPAIPVNWVPADDGGLMGVYRTETTVGVCHVRF